jgi:hypothetical protein
MLRIRWFMLLPICLLAGPGVSLAQTSVSLESCNRALDAYGFDSLTPFAKQNVLVQYANCVRRVTTLPVNRNYSEAVRATNAAGADLRRASIGAVQGQAATQRLLLQNQQSAELAALDQTYEEKALALQQGMTLENRDARRADAQQLLADTRANNAVVRERQQTCKQELEGQIRDALIKVDKDVDTLVNADLDSLSEQHEEKLRYIGNMFDRFISAAPGESIAQQTANQQIGTIAELEGTARIIHAGQTRNAAVGMPVYGADRLITDARSRVFVKFSDGTDLRISESADIDMSEVSKSNTEEKRSLLNDLFVYTAGLIGKKDPPPLNQAEVKASCGGTGIRG